MEIRHPLRYIESMNTRRRIGVMILLVDFVLAATLTCSGILFYRVGPPPPPSRIVAEEHTATSNYVEIVAYGQNRLFRRSVGLPILAIAVVGLFCVVLPVRRERNE